MSISLEDIKHLETLARLRLGESNREKLLGEVASIVEYVGQINDLEMGEIDNSTLMHTHKNIVKPDLAAASGADTLRLILDNASAVDGTYIKVSQVIKK